MPRYPVQVELIGDGVTLRPPREDDAADGLAMLQDADVRRWNPAPLVVDLETAREWCARGADWGGDAHATWHALDRETGRLVATCSVFSIDRTHAVARIGYRVAPWARRRGVGREVVDRVARWSFTELGLARLQLDHAVPYIASCRLATAAGFALEGTLLSASLDGFGQRHDDHVHGRLAVEITLV